MGTVLTPDQIRKYEKDYAMPDADSPGHACLVMKIVDVTSDCPGVREGRCFLVFSHATAGIIVTISQRSVDDRRQTTGIFYRVAKLEAELRGSDSYFPHMARQLGLEPPQLKGLIALYVPA